MQQILEFETTELKRKRDNERAKRYKDRNKDNPIYKERKSKSDKKYLERNKDRVLKYKGVRKHINRARIGVCNLCRAVKGIDCKQTQWHHIEYDDGFKEKHIIELCASCHRKETTLQQGKERLREIGRITRKYLTPQVCAKGGRVGMASRYSKYGKDAVLKQMNANRLFVYNRWTGQLVKRRTFNNV